MNKAKILTFMAMTVMFLTGCEDGTEPDTLGYVVAIGVDAPENDHTHGHKQSFLAKEGDQGKERI